MAGLYPKTEEIHAEETWEQSDVGVPPNGMVKAQVGSRPELRHLISLMHWAKTPSHCILNAVGLFQSVCEFKPHLTSCCTQTIHLCYCSSGCGKVSSYESSTNVKSASLNWIVADSQTEASTSFYSNKHNVVSQNKISGAAYVADYHTVHKTSFSNVQWISIVVKEDCGKWMAIK